MDQSTIREVAEQAYKEENPRWSVSDFALVHPLTYKPRSPKGDTHDFNQ